MVNFQRITLRNFLSVGNKPLTLEYKEGLHYVTGRDKSTGSRNGVGKTALFADGIMFALFGKTLRKSKVGGFINRRNRRDCEVKLEFNIDGKDYIITRGIYPSFLRLTDHTGAELELSKKKETQQIINDIIKLDFNACKNLLIMSINSTRNFMAMSKWEKRNFIEQIMSIYVLGIMYRMVSEKNNVLKADLKNIGAQQELTQKHYDNAREHNEKLEGKHRDFEKGKADRLKQHDRIIHKLEQRRAGTGSSGSSDGIESSEQLQELREKKTKLHTRVAVINTQIQTLNQTIAEIREQSDTLGTEGKCPLCGCIITEKHRDLELKKLRKQIERHEQRLGKETAAKGKLEGYIIPLDTRISDIVAARGFDQKLRTELEKLTNEISLQRRMKIHAEQEKFEGTGIDIGPLKTDYDKLTKNLAGLKEDQKYILLMRSILSDEGIKSYIIKQILPLFNQKMAYYLERLGAVFKVEFDENLNEILKTRGRDVLPYDNLSAGEQKRVDLALLLTFIDIARLQGKTTTNLLVLDELLDSSLSTEGIDQFMVILEEKAREENMAIYVISHRKDYRADIYNSIIILEKQDGFTRVKAVFDG